MNPNDTARIRDAIDADQSAQAPRSLIEQATPALVGFWRILGQNRYWLLGPVLAALVLGWLTAQMTTPIYQATSTVLIETTKSKIVSIEEVYPGLSADRDYLRTQTQFLRSREVLLRVIRDLNLVAHPQFADAVSRARGPSDAGRRAAFPAVRGERTVVTDPAEEAVFAALSAGLEIEPVRQSQLVLVKFESPDPVLAARIANRISEAFIQAEMDIRLQMTVGANNWLASRVAEMKARLDEAETALADAREKANLIERRGGSVGEAGQQTTDLLQRLVDASVRRAQIEELYRKVRPGVPGRENAAPVAANPNVIRARDQLADAEAKFASVSGRFGSSHPAYKAAEIEVQAARNAVRQRIESVIVGISKDYEVAVATEKSLQATVDRNKKATQSDNRKEAQLATLEQDVLSNRQLYQTFLARLKETSAAADVQTPKARIVDSAIAPARPIKPRSLLIMASFMLAGLLAGVMIAVVRSQTDTTARSVEDLEKRLGQPVITTLPVLTREETRARGRLVATEPASYFSEMMRMGAASVHYSLLEGNIRSIAVTSAIAAEGKSTIAANLALALSRTNRVLLIDGDLYRPSLHRLLGLDDAADGLAQVLLGDAEAGDVIREVPGTRLKIITAGKFKGDPFNIVTAPHARRLIGLYEEQFDVVIVDSPPLEVVSDGMMLSAACARSLVVARSGSTPLLLVDKALKRLRRINAKVLGVILNGHDFKAAERYYGEASAHKSYEQYTAGTSGGTGGSAGRSRKPALNRPALAQAPGALAGAGARRVAPRPPAVASPVTTSAAVASPQSPAADTPPQSPPPSCAA